MFGTLIVELPCTYTGAKLSVFDPEDGAGREEWAGAESERPTHEFCWAGESEEGIRFTAFCEFPFSSSPHHRLSNLVPAPPLTQTLTASTASTR